MLGTYLRFKPQQGKCFACPYVSLADCKENQGFQEVLCAVNALLGTAGSWEAHVSRLTVLLSIWPHLCPQLMLFFQPACPVPLVNLHVTPPEGPGPKSSSHRNHPSNPKSRIIFLLHSHRNPTNQSIISRITFSLFLGISNTCNSGERWKKKKVSMISENLPPSPSIRFIWALFSKMSLTPGMQEG